MRAADRRVPAAPPPRTPLPAGCRPLLLVPLLALAGGVLPGSATAVEAVAGLPPAGVSLDGDPGEWVDRPPQFVLAAGAPAGGRGGRVWLAQSEAGLIVAGQAGGPPPSFPATAADIGRADHVVVWLTLADDLVLPKIGWRTPLGPVGIDGADDCARVEEFAADPIAVDECRHWYAEQLAYRRQFRRLFQREWRLAPGIIEETLAEPAFARLDDERRAVLAPLAPRQRPVARFSATAGIGFGFEILVPWAALPPSPTLDLTRLRVAVEVPGAAAPPPATVPGDAPATAAAARRGAALLLEPARRWRLTPCGYPLGTPAPAAGSSPAASVFVLPSTAGDVADVLTIRNDEREEKGDLTVMSPIIHHTRYFSRLLEPGVVLCGPTVAVRRGDASLISPALEIHPLFRSRPTADGWLIADGPYTIAAGEARGQVGGGCSECPAITLQVLFLPRAGGLPIVAFADTWPMAADAIEAGATRDARVAIADDLLTITAWEAGSDERRGNGDWTGVRHCFEAASATFRECGPRFEAAPPADVRLPPEAPPS